MLNIELCFAIKNYFIYYDISCRTIALGKIMKKNNIYICLILGSAVILSGCGNDDSDLSLIPGNSSNYELNYTTFDIFTEVVNDRYRTGWGKIDFKINNNNITRVVATAAGSSPNAYQNRFSDSSDRYEYYAAVNTFAKVPENPDNRFYKVNFINQYRFKLDIQSDNRPIEAIYDVKTLDLNGVTKLKANAVSGIYTDLNYDYFPNNLSFPKDSKCYVLQETPLQDYYTFYDGNIDNATNIDQWLTNQQRYRTLNNIVKEKIGRVNELSAARYTDQDGKTIAAVVYNGKVYDAYYYPKNIKQDANIDFTREVVSCTLYNKMAANFLEAQIKANYKN